MTLPKGALFDLDDTVIAFDAAAQPVWERLCERYAQRTGKCTPQALLSAVQHVRRWYWSDLARHRKGRQNLKLARRQIVRLAFERLELGDTSLADEIADTYSTERDAAIHCFPGAEETLQHLVDNGVRLALITNGGSEQQWRKIKRFRLDRFFSAVLVEGDLGYGKPDLRIYLRAMEELGLQPADVWAVGDNLEWDVSGPQKLGIYSIWHDYRGLGLPSDSLVVPDRIIGCIAELTESV